MAGYSSRQSTYTSGDTITAAHSNDEFNQVLAAFHATTGHSHDGTAGEGGPVTTLRDSDALNKILVDTSNNHLEFYVEVSSAAVQQLRIQDGAIVPITDNDIDLGTSSLEFKDLFIDGTANIDALVADTADINGGTVDGATLGTNSAITQAVIDNININGATIGHTDDTDLLTLADGVLTVAGEVSMTTLDIGGTNITATAAELNILDGVTSTASELNLVDGITAGTVSASKAVIVDSNKDLTGLRNLTISGDLTVSGDDITMGTNTAGNLLVADGTNFNSIAVGSLSEISTVASDDVLLAVDTSGGGLKKITRSTLTAGIVSGSEISNIVEDTSPQLGGNLDMNGQDIVTTSNADIDLAPNGTGKVVVKGNSNPGTVVFNCESNSHGQTVKSQPHSASVTNVLTLPPGGDQEIVGTTATQTLTNKTLTTPVIAEIDSSGNITLDADGAINLDADNTTINLKDGGTKFGVFANDSSHFAISSDISDKDIIFKGSDGGSSVTALTLDMSDAGTANFNNHIQIANDSGQIKLGASQDLAIYHDGTHSHIRDQGTGDLRIRGSVIQLLNASSQEYLVATSGGSVDIYHNDVKKFETTSAGVTVTGNILISDAGNIGSASDSDAIAIASNGVVTFSQTPVNSAGAAFVTDDPTALAIALG